MKIFAKFIIIFVSVLFLSIIFLSIYGIESKYFNSVIQKKIKTINPGLELRFDKTKVKLDIKNLKFKVKFYNTQIGSKNNLLDIKDLNSNISLRAVIKREFPILNIKAEVDNINITKIINLTNTIKQNTASLILKQSVDDGQISGDLNFNFDKDGNIKDNFFIKGKINNFKFNLLNKYKLEQVDASFNIKKNYYLLNILKASYLNINFSSSKIEFIGDKKEANLKAIINSKADLIKIENFLELLKIPSDKHLLQKSKVSFNIKNHINLNLKNYFKIINSLYDGNGSINYFSFNNKTNNIKSFIKNINSKLEFKKNNIKYNIKNNKLFFNSNGLVKLSNKYEKYSSSLAYDFKNKNFQFQNEFNIDSLSLDINSISYKKKIGDIGQIKFEGNVKNQENLNLNYLEFTQSKNKIFLKKLNFDNNFKIKNFKKLSVKTYINNRVNNNFIITKNKKNFLLKGSIYDGTFIFQNIYNNNNNRILNENFDLDISIKLNEVISDKNNILYDLSAIGKIKKGQIDSLTAKAKFSDNEFVDLIITKKNDKIKNLSLYSDRAEPFVQGFKFIKGFEDGKLEYFSNYDNVASSSNLKIYDFKLQDVPLLTKLLTLGSLQGIADLLTGEGIRFNELEIDFNSKNKLTSIKEMYAIGPAISLLMDGYIETNKIVSLRGTLVPATTLNKVIGSIPLLGEILIGPKTGEGVFGVSFKIKGSPKNLKTTVNPIKTLTPRFITRTLKKIKN